MYDRNHDSAWYSFPQTVSPMPEDSAPDRPGNLRADAVADRIRNQIARGELAGGDRLESLRAYARLCGCAKNTVVAAYERLVEEGLIEPRRGAGYFVTGQRRLPARDAWAPSMVKALSLFGVHDAMQPLPPHSPADGLPPSAWLEPCRLDRYLQKVGRSGLGTVFRTGDPLGYEPLRQHLARRLQDVGVRVDPSNIVLTHGAFHALDLMIRLWVRPGDTVLVDAPGFYPTVNMLRRHGARIVGIRRTVDGPDLDQLTRVLARSTAKLYFTQSVAHNPTGTDITPRVARELVSLASARGVRVVDDDAFADYKPASALRLGSLDQLEGSVYVGSFSKSVSSLLRAGFIAANEEDARLLVDLKMVTALNTSQYVERALDAIITEGRFQRHVFQLQKTARGATRKAAAALDTLGAEIMHVPQASLYLWARFPGVTDSVDFAQKVAAHGCVLAPGAMFYPTSELTPWLRFNVGYTSEPSVSDALRAALSIR